MDFTKILNKIFQGEVTSVHNYGAFIKFPALGKTQGLVHKSQISSSRVDDATEVLERNEKVWCKVISINDDGKIGLSMKVVDQGNGSDLDPNGVQVSLDANQRKQKFMDGESKAITLDAIFKTTCSRCGVSGHLSKNCFTTPDSKTYDLIPEPEVTKIFGSVEDRLRRIAAASASVPEDSIKLKEKVPTLKRERRKKSISDEITAKKRKKPHKKRSHRHSDSESPSNRKKNKNKKVKKDKSLKKKKEDK